MPDPKNNNDDNNNSNNNDNGNNERDPKKLVHYLEKAKDKTPDKDK